MLLKQLIFLLVASIAVSSLAQDAELPQYQVEVIVVRNLNPSVGTEVFPLVIEREESELPMDTFLPVAPDSLDLSEMSGKISRSRNFRSLNHSGWTQPGFAREEARGKVFLTTASTGETVSGHIVLTRERYLRLALDLTLEVEGESYRLKTQRRMISRQVHYFDNPYFGVIAKITPL